MIYQNKKNWKSSQFDYDYDVLAMIKHERNNIVSAGPGAGKTEFLAQKACFLLETGLCRYPFNILAITFKNDASRNLKARVNERCPKVLANNFQAMTFHAFCKQILDQFRETLPDDFKPSHDYTINSLHRDEWSEIKRETDINKCGFQFGILYLSEFNETQQEEIKNFWNRQLLQVNDSQSNLTFDMVVALSLYILLKNNDIADVIRKKYPYIFVDEFQDTTTVQYYLLSLLFKGKNNNITVVGDLKQTIMGWAGAKKEVDKHFIADFNAAEFQLNINYRSNNCIVSLVNTITEYMRDNVENDRPIAYSLMVALADHQGDNQSVLIRKDFGTRQEQYNCVSGEIKNLINQGIKPHEILIIRRQKVAEVEDEFSNFGNGISIINADKEFGDFSIQDFQGDSCADFLISILSLVYGVNIKNINAWNIFYDTMSTIRGVNEDRDTSNFFGECIKIIDDIKENISDKIFGDIEDILTNPPFVKIINELVNNYALFQYNSQDNVEKTIDSFSQYVKFLANRTDDWKSLIEQYHGFNSVHLMTIHKSKGLEYNTVFFIDVDGDMFWSNDGVNTQFFVACSRAKERIRIYASSESNSGKVARLLNHLIGNGYGSDS